MEPLCDHYTYVRWHRWFGGTWTFGQFIWSTFLLIYPFQKIKFWKSTSAGVWDCDILNMTSFWNFGNAPSDNLTSVKWNRHCAQLVEEPFWENSLQEGFIFLEGKHCWRMYDVGAYPSCYLLSIIHLTSCMAPIVGPGKGGRLNTCLHFWKWRKNNSLKFLQGSFTPLFYGDLD